MPYYKSLKECIENPTRDNKDKHVGLLTDYINLLKDTNESLVNNTHDDYTSQFNTLFQFYRTTREL